MIFLTTGYTHTQEVILWKKGELPALSPISREHLSPENNAPSAALVTPLGSV